MNLKLSDEKVGLSKTPWFGYFMQVKTYITDFM
jgi:hypothetical protein